MRNEEYSTDLEVVKQYEGMRNNLCDCMERWLTIEQLMRTSGYTHHDPVAEDSWYKTAYETMTALECLTDIVANAPGPTPMHWVRWREETRYKVEAIDDRMKFLISRYKRP